MLERRNLPDGQMATPVVKSHGSCHWNCDSHEENPALDRAGCHDFILRAEVARPPSAIGEFLKATGFTSACDFSAGIARDVFGKSGATDELSRILLAGARHSPSPS